MATTAYIYDNFPLNLMSKLVADMSSASSTIKVALCSSSYTPNQASHTSFNDITDEITGVGYTAGGAEITNKTLTATTRTVTFDGNDVSWTNASLTARYAVVYDASSNGATNQKLIGYLDFGQDYSSNAAVFSVVWNTSGILTWTVS